METKIVAVPVDQINDWPTFHDVFQREFGFLGGYGRNMDAWIDCMTSLDIAEDGMSTVTVAQGGLVIHAIDGADDFKKRCPEQYNALIECSAFVNYRRMEIGETPVIALRLSGHF
jgi:hypothetical protein